MIAYNPSSWEHWEVKVTFSNTFESETSLCPRKSRRERRIRRSIREGNRKEMGRRRGKRGGRKRKEEGEERRREEERRTEEKGGGGL